MIQRGELFEVEVELGADPIFNISTMITSMRDVIQEFDQLSGSQNLRLLNQMRSLAQIIDSLLGGLVPIKGRLKDYQSVRITDRDILVHNTLLDQIPISAINKHYPVFLVGVIQHDLFWKDIRRVLFSNAHYTMFCRLSRGNLADSWRPIKGLDALSTIDPSLSTQVQQLGEFIGESISAGFAVVTQYQTRL